MRNLRRKNKGIIILLIWIGTSLVSAFAQTPYFRSHPFDKSLGKIQPTVLFQDKIGKQWMGTRQGLFFSDGLNYVPQPLNDSLSHHVTAISEVAQKLWVGFNDGQIRWLENGEFQDFQPEEGVPEVAITGIIQNKNQVWIATYGEGVYVWNGKRLYNFNIDDGLLGDEVYSMAKDSLGRVWVGTDNGVSICKFENAQKSIENLTEADGLPDMIVKKIIADKAGNMWLGMFEKGVCRFDVAKKKFDFFIEKWSWGAVNSLTLFEGKELWIGTQRNGLVRLNLQNHQIENLENWKDIKILDSQKDIEGNLWIASQNGVQSANKQFEYVNLPLENNQTLLCTKAGEIWMGTSSGLFQFDKSTKKYIPSPIKDNVISLLEMGDGSIWVGTFGQGIKIFEPKNQSVKSLNIDLPNGSILDIERQGNQVWLATLGGIVRFQLSNSKIDIFQKNDGIGANYVYDIFIDSQGRVWLATDGQGITLFDKGKFTNYAKADNQTIKTVYSITEDKNGNIWFSTAKDGIYKFNGKSFQHFSYQEGLRDVEISSLITDAKGNILIVHPTGIDLLDPLTHHLIYYDTEVGIGEIEPNLNVFDTDKNGNIWLGTKTGLIQYLPLEEILEIHPHTILQQVSVYLEPIDFQSKKRFSYRENHLTFEFVGLWYTDPKAVQYRYRIKGYDLDWNYTKDLRATYPSLPAGNYTFELQSSENEGFEGVPTVTYDFRIRLPFWRKAWFIVLMLVSLGSLIYAWMKHRERQLKKAEALKKEKIEFELQTLKSQVNPHFLFNSFNTLLNVIDNDTEIAAEYVEKLSDFYRNILQYQNQTVIPLSDEIELVQNYFYLLQKRYDKNIQLNINVLPSVLQLQLPPMTLQMLVENAVKHNTIAKSMPLSIEITSINKDYLSIKNNLQPKITPPISTHFGLRSIQKRYELLNDKNIEIIKTETDFEVKIPLLRMS